jgi:anti-sigma B factor antagonist
MRLFVFRLSSPGQRLMMSEEADMTRHLVPSLRLPVEHQVPWTIVRVSGELGWESHAMLDDCLSELVLEAERPCVCIDLTALEFCDSSGIACMVRAWRTATRKGGLLVVVRPSGYLARKLRRMGLDDVLPVVNEPPGDSGPALSIRGRADHAPTRAVTIALINQWSHQGAATSLFR